MINLTEKYLKKYKLKSDLFYTRTELINKHKINYAMFYRIDTILNLFEKKTDDNGEVLYRLNNKPFCTGIDKDFNNLVQVFRNSNKKEIPVFRLSFRK